MVVGAASTRTLGWEIKKVETKPTFLELLHSLFCLEYLVTKWPGSKQTITEKHSKCVLAKQHDS